MGNNAWHSPIRGVQYNRTGNHRQTKLLRGNMNNENLSNVCTNCKYFQRFYVLGLGGAFRPTMEGRCIHLKTDDKSSAKHIHKNEGCDLWQPYELQKLFLQYCIEERVERIYKYVEEILAILRNVE